MQNNKKLPSKRSPKDKYILFAFLAFFGVIFVLDGIFVYTAISTQTGVITEQAYEKGLNYNETLEQARNQPRLNDEASFQDGVLSWHLKDESNKVILGATTTARMIRPIQGGHDFDIGLESKGNGLYQAALDLPLKGLWIVKLESTWNDKTYKTTHQFIVK